MHMRSKTGIIRPTTPTGAEAGGYARTSRNHVCFFFYGGRAGKTLKGQSVTGMGILTTQKTRDSSSKETTTSQERLGGRRRDKRGGDQHSTHLDTDRVWMGGCVRHSEGNGASAERGVHPREGCMATGECHWWSWASGLQLQRYRRLGSADVITVAEPLVTLKGNRKTGPRSSQPSVDGLRSLFLFGRARNGHAGMRAAWHGVCRG
jgi:hypothetical protein